MELCRLRLLVCSQGLQILSGTRSVQEKWQSTHSPFLVSCAEGTGPPDGGCAFSGQYLFSRGFSFLLSLPLPLPSPSSCPVSLPFERLTQIDTDSDIKNKDLFSSKENVCSWLKSVIWNQR